MSTKKKKPNLVFDDKTGKWEPETILIQGKPLIPEEEFTKLLNESLESKKQDDTNTWNLYRSRGLILRKYLKRYEWNKELRKKYCETMEIKKRTSEYYLQLADMTEEEFTQCIAQFGSVYKWTQKEPKESLTITIKELLGLFGIELTKKEQLEKFLSDNDIKNKGIFVHMEIEKDKVEEIKQKLRDIKHGKFVW